MRLSTPHNRPQNGTVQKALSRRSVLVMALISAMVGISGPDRVVNAEPISREYKLKVAYLYNFGRYMQWPKSAFEDANAPFVIGILGEDPFGQSIDALAAKKKIHGRKIVIKRFSSVDQYSTCQMLFVARSSTFGTRQEILQKTVNDPLLLVGETEGFALDGASAVFFNDANGTVGFRINVDTLARKTIVADAKLLKLATIVQDSETRTSKRILGGRRW